jgi:hypothetical protein
MHGVLCVVCGAKKIKKNGKTNLPWRTSMGNAIFSFPSRKYLGGLGFGDRPTLSTKQCYLTSPHLDQLLTLGAVFCHGGKLLMDGILWGGFGNGKEYSNMQ